MIADIRGIYAAALAFAVACPVLFLIPVLVEMMQHVAEMQAGMYISEAGAKAAESDPLRLYFGFAKTVAILLPGYWFTRFILLGDARRAGAIEWPAIGLWLIVFAVLLVQLWWRLFGPPVTGLLGLEDQLATGATVALEAVSILLSIYLTAWVVAWAVGNAAIHPLRSFAIMQGSFWHTVGLMIAGIVPLMALHYGLAIAAVLWLPDVLDWAVMAIDTVVVGFLALTMAGSATYAARHAARRKHIDLLPDRT